MKSRLVFLLIILTAILGGLVMTRENVIFMVGGDTTPKMDGLFTVDSTIRPYSGKVAYSESSIGSLRAIDRNSVNGLIIKGGKGALSKLSNGNGESLWTSSGLATDSIVNAIKNGVDQVGRKWLIGGETSDPYAFLLSYDETTFTDETANLTGWTDGGIYAIDLYVAPTGFWLMGGTDGVSSVLWYYTGAIWGNLTATLNAVKDMVNIRCISHNTSVYFILVGNSGAVVKWNLISFTDLTVAAGFSDDLYVSFYSTKLGKFLVGGDNRSFKSFDGTDWVDLSASLKNWGAGNSIRAVCEIGNYIYIAGSGGELNRWDGITFEDMSNSLKDLSTLNVSGILGYETHGVIK